MTRGVSVTGSSDESDGRPLAARTGNGRSIFVSYRRSDAQTAASRLVGDLERYYGSERIYFDLRSNTPAQNYVRAIERALLNSKMLIAVMGPTWLTAAGGAGGRRIDDPSDLVRREIELALTSGVEVLVVTVSGATVPRGDELPDSLRSLSVSQALPLTDSDWAYNFGRVIEALEGYGLDAPSWASNEPVKKFDPKELVKQRRYERTFQVTRKRAFDVVASAVDKLHYGERKISIEAAQVGFRVGLSNVVVKIIDAEPGYSTVVVEMASVKTRFLAGGALAATIATGGLASPMLAAWPALRAWEMRFAKGFLDNVQSLIEGRGIIEDSARLPGVENWYKRSRKI